MALKYAYHIKMVILSLGESKAAESGVRIQDLKLK